jgi:amino acid transporter
MSFIELLLGKPLASDEQKHQKIGPLTGIPIFGLDALGSASYGPEAALTYVSPVIWTIIVLLAIVYFSYRQTIEAYPSGGGSYTVASENLGVFPGLLAGAALLVDYVLVAAVGISAGIGALISAFPALQPHTLALCLSMLVLMTVVNLRGVRDTGLVTSAS